jgi:two-component sensor histidine kinase
MSSAAATFREMLRRSRGLPRWQRYAITLGIVGATALLREVAKPLLPPDDAFSLFYLAILLCSALFDRGSGFLATLLAATITGWSWLSPAGLLSITDPRHASPMILFILFGCATAAIVEMMHKALEEARTAHASLTESHDVTSRAERARTLMLREFRHRTRNDLGALVALLMLRARTAPSEAAGEALREAADHALALARVHTRLATDEGLSAGTEAAVVDTRDFIAGLCADLRTAQVGAGLRPVALECDVESHSVSTERAVPLGLVLNEAVTNALKYAFPEDRPGVVRVTFRRDGEEYVLTVEDDGIGLPPEGEVPEERGLGRGGLGMRLLAGLAAQLRGSFTRRPGPCSAGTVAVLRFPVSGPSSNG